MLWYLRTKAALVAVLPTHRLGVHAFWAVVDGSVDGHDDHIERYLDGGWSAEFPDGKVLILTPKAMSSWNHELS